MFFLQASRSFLNRSGPKIPEENLSFLEANFLRRFCSNEYCLFSVARKRARLKLAIVGDCDSYLLRLHLPIKAVCRGNDLQRSAFWPLDTHCFSLFLFCGSYMKTYKGSYKHDKTRNNLYNNICVYIYIYVIYMHESASLGRKME